MKKAPRRSGLPAHCNRRAHGGLVLSVLATAAAATAAGAVAPHAAAQALPPRAAEEPSQGGIIDRILARVNGEAILHSELKEQWEAQLPVLQSQIPSDQLTAQEAGIRMALLEGMIDQLMVLQRAQDLGINAEANDIDRALSRLREANGLISDEAFEQALAADGITLTELRDQLRKQIVRQRLIFEEVQRQIFVSQLEIADYYEVNSGEFREPPQVLFQQIVFLVEEGEKPAVLETAEAALAELRGGVSLNAVGSKYEGAQVFGGEGISWVSIEDMQPELAAAVEGLTPGAYSDPVESRFGYHILQLLDRKAEVVQSLEEVLEEIRQTLLQQKQGERFERYAQELRENSHVEILADEYTDLTGKWGNARTTTPPDERR